MKTLFITITSILITIGVYAQSYKADIAKTNLVWTATKVVGGGHTGNIQLKSGNLVLSGNTITGGTFVIDMKTISCTDITDAATNKKFISHLHSNDFFSVGTHATATLSIREQATFSNNTALVKANLTIKGITKPIEFTTQKNGNTYTAQIPVDRTLYDIRYGSGSFFDNLGNSAISNIFTLNVTLVMKQ